MWFHTESAVHLETREDGAFGAESAVGTRHYDNTGDALRALKERGVVVWALETVDGAVCLTRPRHSFTRVAGRGALVFGNEVTGVTSPFLDSCTTSSRSRRTGRRTR